MFKLITVFILAFFLNSCANRKWTDTDRKKFIADCISQAQGTVLADKAKSYCECMQPVVEAKYPTVAEANSVKASDMQTPEMQAAATKCLQ